MIKQYTIAALMSAALLTLSHTAIADHDTYPQAISHAPIGVMGNHTHTQGEWMFSYRFMRMNMDGNQDGTSNLSADDIARTPNGIPGMPNLRVVPTRMEMDMHMLGAMYALNDDLTLMAMVNYLDIEMDHTAYAGMMGTNKLGTFTTKSRGFGDVKLGGLYNLYKDDSRKIHLNLGVSLPTGSIKETANVLAPNGQRPRLRVPYAMQLGSGTYDLLPGITYQAYTGKWNLGAQYLATIRLGENSQDYTLGDEHKVSTWAAYAWRHDLSTSLRLTYTNLGKIDGRDTKIGAPVQTADPDNYGYKRVDIQAGLNWISSTGHRLAFEVGAPVYQNLNGPQMETDWTLTAGYQYAF